MDNPIQRLVDAMSDDLPRRCREAAETSFSGRGVLYAAADRIEALVKENARLNKSRNKWGQKYNKELLAHRETHEKLRMAVMSDSEYAAAVDAKCEALVLENEELDFLKWEGGEESVGREIEKAFQRGREAGIRDAAQTARRYTVVADQKFDDVLAKAQAGVKNLSLAGACATGMMHMAEGIERAILALIDKQENEQ